MGHLSPWDIVRYPKGEDQPWFVTLEEYIKDAPQGDIWKIRVLFQEYTPEEGEDILNPTNSPYQISTKLEEVDKDVVGSEITREYIAKL